MNNKQIIYTQCTCRALQ